MPAARLAESWRMRRSPPYLKQWRPAAKLTKGEHLKTPDGSLAVADGGTAPAVRDGWMWDLTVPRQRGPRLLCGHGHHASPCTQR